MANLLSYGFNRLNQTDMAAFAAPIVERMTANPIFIHLKPEVDVLKLNLDAYNAAAAAAVNGGSEFYLAKNDSHAALKAQLSLVAQYVDVMSIDKPAIVLAAGFELLKQTQPVPDFTAPVGLVLDYGGASGTLKLSWKAVAGSINYCIEGMTKTDPVWKNGLFSTRKEVLLTDLEPGSFVTYRVRAVGRGGKVTGWSAEISGWVR